MKRILEWWYRLSLPALEQGTTPLQRERARYAKLTSSFLLLLLVLFLPLAPVMIFDSPRSPSSPPIAVGMLFFLLASWISGRMGHQIVSATCIVAYAFFSVTGPLVTNPLDPTLLPLFNALVVAVILAGSLLPPLAALIAGACSCINIILISFLQPHTTAYTQMMQQQLFTVSLVLPATIQIVVAVIVYVIMNNLIKTVRRADRAEEIASLRQELMQQTQEWAAEQEQLARGVEIIAQVHARIANGELDVRVPLNAESVLWKIAVPLNNLLNRLQSMNEKASQFDRVSNAIAQVQQQMQRPGGRPVSFAMTRTPLDPLLQEYNRSMATLSQQSTSQRPKSPF
ncbi:MAG: hypothetical protein M3Y39_04520 [Chloroflexota bacterium]|nr:hypothetical protein [Chloroflexota bacterium]